MNDPEKSRTKIALQWYLIRLWNRDHETRSKNNKI